MKKKRKKLLTELRHQCYKDTRQLNNVYGNSNTYPEAVRIASKCDLFMPSCQIFIWGWDRGSAKTSTGLLAGFDSQLLKTFQTGFKESNANHNQKEARA